MSAQLKPKHDHELEKKKRSNVIPTVGFKYLGPTLPSGFARLFQVRRAGRYWGLTVECPVCHEKPPRECDYGLRRWRWLSVHLAAVHKRGR